MDSILKKVFEARHFSERAEHVASLLSVARDLADELANQARKLEAGLAEMYKESESTKKIPT